MTARFVILHHQVHEGEHWDLMLEHGDVLLTWRLPREPTSASSLPMPVERIADHRTAYLDYEGPVSRDRGHVTRVDGGTVEFESVGDTEYTLRLGGTRLTGRFVLRASDGHWLFDVQS